MKRCELIYKGQTDLGDYTIPKGVYDFQELPRVGDEIDITGLGTYTVTRVVHKFFKPSTAEEISKENKITIYME